MATPHDATAHVNTSTHNATRHVGVGVHAYLNNATQSISTATQTPLTMNAEVFDTDGFHDNTTNNTRITIPSGLGGIYLLNGGILSTAGTSFRWIFGWKKNDSESGYISEARLQPAGTDFSMDATAIVNLLAGDFVTLYIFHEAGISRTILGQQPGYSFGSAVLLGT